MMRLMIVLLFVLPVSAHARRDCDKFRLEPLARVQEMIIEKDFFECDFMWAAGTIPELNQFGERKQFTENAIRLMAMRELGLAGFNVQKLGDNRLVNLTDESFVLLLPIIEKLRELDRRGLFTLNGVKNFDRDVSFEITAFEAKFLRVLIHLLEVETYLPKWLGPVAQNLNYSRIFLGTHDKGERFGISKAAYAFRIRIGHFVEYELLKDIARFNQCHSLCLKPVYYRFYRVKENPPAEIARILATPVRGGLDRGPQHAYLAGAITKLRVALTSLSASGGISNAGEALGFGQSGVFEGQNFFGKMGELLRLIGTQEINANNPHQQSLRLLKDLTEGYLAIEFTYSTLGFDHEQISRMILTLLTGKRVEIEAIRRIEAELDLVESQNKFDMAVYRQGGSIADTEIYR